MEFAADSGARGHVVLSYGAHEIRLRDRTLRASAIVTAAQVLDWPVAGVETLEEAALAPLYALGVDVVLLATGARQQFPPRAVYAALLRRGIGLEVMDVGAACRTYNVLLAESRRVALAAVISPAAAAGRPDPPAGR